jgi:hypothetical protein
MKASDSAARSESRATGGRSDREMKPHISEEELEKVEETRGGGGNSANSLHYLL